MLFTKHSHPTVKHLGFDSTAVCTRIVKPFLNRLRHNLSTKQSFYNTRTTNGVDAARRIARLKESALGKRLYRSSATGNHASIYGLDFCIRIIASYEVKQFFTQGNLVIHLFT